jgi:peroxiredoxin
MLRRVLGQLVTEAKSTVLGQKGATPKAGDTAPDFTLAAHDGSTVSLSALRGKTVVLWFYPKADTPG